MTDILVISDLHCTSVGRPTERSFLRPDLMRSPSTRHPVASLLDLKKKNPELRADILLCPGDVADKIDKQGLMHGVVSLNEIADEFKCRGYISSIGNHDIDSRGIHASESADPLFIAKNIFPTRYPFVEGDLQTQFWEKGSSFHVYDDILILNVNSVQHAGNEALAKKGRFHDIQLSFLLEQLEERKEELKTKPWIALFHHHPIQHEVHHLGADDLMENGENLLNALIKYDCDLVIHGHKHHSRLGYYSDGAKRLPVLSAGSFSEQIHPELAQTTSNMFHVVHIERKGFGTVDNWKFLLGHGWVPCETAACGIEHSYGFSKIDMYDIARNKLLAHLEAGGRRGQRWVSAMGAVEELKYLNSKEIIRLEDDLENSGYSLHRRKGHLETIFSKIS